jgi:hypothetical protein
MGLPVKNMEIQSSIAFCGLICRLCFLAAQCDGCKTANNRCERNLSDEGCFQKSCCQQKGLDGCWQCSDLKDCTQGIYSQGEYSKIKAFALCIQQDGMDAFAADVMRNEAAGLSVEKGRDYDGKLIPVVLRLLRTGNE